MNDCVFCEIVAGRAPATVVWETISSLMIVPLGPVVEGHILAIPKTHIRDAAEWPELTSVVARDVAAYAQEQERPFNLITSAGTEATQTVFHLHIHYVPRREGDCLALPWTDQP